jgi:hypothetical protein
MNFLSVLYARAGITVDGVTTLNNTATGLTPATNDNSTKLATTGYVKNQNYYPYPTGTTLEYVRGDGSLATFPSLSGYVPYTGATANVNLGTHSLTASDLVINHASGSGVAASITKGGAGEALTVVKSSGSGNAASITGGTTLISELNLTTDLADAYIASAATWNAKQNAITLTTTGTSGAATLVGATLNIPQYQAVLTNPITGTGTTNFLAKFTGASALGNSNIFNDGIIFGIGTSTPGTTTANTLLGFVLGSNIQARNAVPQLAISSNINGEWYSPTYKVTNFATQIYLDSNQGTIALRNAPSGTAGDNINWNTPALFVANNSNVGIGTTSPTKKLDVVGTTDTSIRVRDTGGASLELYQQATSSYILATNILITYTGGSERMRVDSTGNVIIGATTPTATLDVRSKAGASSVVAPTFRAYGYDTDSYFQVNNNASNSADIKLTRSDAITMFEINGHTGVAYFNGNMGIGTTPANSYTPSLSFEIGANGILWSEKATSVYNSMLIGLNSYFDSAGNPLYKNTGLLASRYIQSQGSHIWDNAPIGTAGAAVTFTTAMRLDAGGQLGLGVTPSAWNGFKALQTIGGSLIGANAELQLWQNAYFDGASKYYATGTATRYSMTSGQHRWYNAVSGTANAALTWVQAMTLDASGNLGIGTTTPAEKLEVKGSTTGVLRLSSTAYSYNLFTNNADGSFYLRDVTNSGNRLIISSTGAATFSSSVTTNSANGFRLDSAGSILFSLGYSGGTLLDRLTGTAFRIAENGSTQLAILSGGNVGIGTNTPAAKLHIQDTNGGVFFDGVGATYNRFKSTTSSAATGKDLLFSAQSAGTTPDLYIKSDGKVGIGTSAPSYTLDVNGTARVSGRLEITTADQITNRITLLNQTSSNRWDIVGGLNGTNQTDFSIYDNTNNITALRIVPATGAATFSSSVTATNFIVPGGTSAQFLKADGSLDSNVYLTSTSSTFSYTSSVTLSPTWQNTGVSSTNLGTGAYLVTCNANDFAVGGGQYDCTYTGLMYFFAGGTNGSNANEIVLHHSGHADQGRYIYLRTLNTVVADGKTYLQISGNGTNSGASNYQFTFKKLL